MAKKKAGKMIGTGLGLAQGLIALASVIALLLLAVFMIFYDRYAMQKVAAGQEGFNGLGPAFGYIFFNIYTLVALIPSAILFLIAGLGELIFGTRWRVATIVFNVIETIARLWASVCLVWSAIGCFEMTGFDILSIVVHILSALVTMLLLLFNLVVFIMSIVLIAKGVKEKKALKKAQEAEALAIMEGAVSEDTPLEEMEEIVEEPIGE